MELDMETMNDMAFVVVWREVQRDKMKQLRELVKQMVTSGDPATSAVGVLASVTLATMAKVIEDDEE